MPKHDHNAPIPGQPAAIVAKATEGPYLARFPYEAAHHRLNLEACGSIHKSGSVTGMQRRFGWPKGGQVRVGAYIYNVGVGEVERLRRAGALRGDA